MVKISTQTLSTQRNILLFAGMAFLLSYGRDVAKLECGLFHIKHVFDLGHYGSWCEYSMGLRRAF